MKSNNEILIDVYRKYKVSSLIKKMIDYSIKDKSCDDLEQYIYEQLLLMDNHRLNTIYSTGKLRNFISQIIKSQRNGGQKGTNTIYVNQFRIHESNEIYQLEQEDLETYDYKIDIIMDYIDLMSELNYSKIEEYSSDQLRTILAFTLLKKYYTSQTLTHKVLAKNLGLSSSTTQLLIKNAKDMIKEYWNNIGINLYKNKI